MQSTHPREAGRREKPERAPAPGVCGAGGPAGHAPLWTLCLAQLEGSLSSQEPALRTAHLPRTPGSPACPLPLGVRGRVAVAALLDVCVRVLRPYCTPTRGPHAPGSLMPPFHHLFAPLSKQGFTCSPCLTKTCCPASERVLPKPCTWSADSSYSSPWVRTLLPHLKLQVDFDNHI